MKTLLTIFLTIFLLKSKAQDTVLVYNNYKYKIGFKLSNEGSTDLSDNIKNTFNVVYGGGFQVIRKFGKSKSSLESGIYLSTKTKNYDYFNLNYFYFYYDYSPFIVYYHYLDIPINYRYDTKIIYFSVGVFFDYLISHNTKHEEFIENLDSYGTDRKFNMGYNLIVGVEKQISRTLNFTVEGKLFNTISWPKMESGNFFLNDGHLKTTFQNYGISIGMNYKFL